jgi:hypothetical protein
MKTKSETTEEPYQQSTILTRVVLLYCYETLGNRSRSLSNVIG